MTVVRWLEVMTMGPALVERPKPSTGVPLPFFRSPESRRGSTSTPVPKPR